MRVLCFGDSITQGFWDEHGGWVQRLRSRLDHKAILELDAGTAGELVEIFNLGVSGDTSSQLLERIAHETKARKQSGEKLIAIVAVGTNDDTFERNDRWVPIDQFKANLEHIVELLYGLTSGVILLGNPACDETMTNPVAWGDYYYTNAELERSEQVIASVAFASGLHYVPLFEGFKARLDVGEALLADGLHPNSMGHTYIAEKVWPVLQDLIMSFKTV